MTNVFGLTVSQPAVSRAIESLKQINLVEGINNPVGNATLAWIKLTNKGRKLQRLYLGSTAEWKDRLRIVSVRTLEEQIVTDSSNINKRTA
jgi:DNA-binding MarR family transcriptional regulator